MGYNSHTKRTYVLKLQRGVHIMIVFTKSDLEQIEYDDSKGFYLDTFYFDSLIDTEDSYLPFKRSIKTTENVLITWTIAVGWIVVPFENGALNYINYSPLAKYLTTYNNKVIVQERQMQTMKEKLINEFIDTLKGHIGIIVDYLEQNRYVSPDELLLVIKEHKQPHTQSFVELKLLLEKELASWYTAKRKLIEFETLDAPALTPNLLKREELSN